MPFLDAYQKALGKNEYYKQVLRVITMLDVPVIKAKRLNGQKWYEIDDIQDLDIATSIFTPNEDEKVALCFCNGNSFLLSGHEITVFWALPGPVPRREGRKAD